MATLRTTYIYKNSKVKKVNNFFLHGHRTKEFCFFTAVPPPTIATKDHERSKAYHQVQNKINEYWHMIVQGGPSTFS